MTDGIGLILIAMVTGIVAGVVFQLLKLPLPAPPSLAGIAGIFGIFAGSQIVEYFMKVLG